jgi:glycosyltransferase involved in cell wall biosynthesis
VPLFSIIIPIFNRASTVSSTIESVLNQAYNDFEIILVDDGSSDEIEKNVSNYIVDNGLIFHVQQNSGVSAARNKGVSLSKGEYLIFLDSDDHVTQNWLSDFEKKIHQKKPDIIYCGINRLKENILIDYTNPQDPYKDGKSFGNVIPGSFCIKSTFFYKIGGFDENLTYGENTELSFRIKIENPSVEFIDTPNLLYTLHENSHGKNERNKMNGLIYTINKHPQLFNYNKEMKRRFLSIAGVAAVHCNDFKIARFLFFKAWGINYFSLNDFLRLFVSFFPILGRKIWANK